MPLSSFLIATLLFGARITLQKSAPPFLYTIVHLQSGNAVTDYRNFLFCFCIYRWEEKCEADLAATVVPAPVTEVILILFGGPA